MQQMKARHLVLCAGALMAVVVGPCTAASLFQQNFDQTGNWWASQNDTNNFVNFATAFDNFTLVGDSLVTGVEWTGLYSNPAQQGTITRFTLQFYSDNGGTPGASLYTFTAADSENETFLGNYSGNLVYTYSADLSGNPFNVTGGTQYWLSIVPDIAFPPQWGWATGSGDSLSYQVFFGTGTVNQVDTAFSLTGTSGAPEPFTWLTMGCGLAAVAIARRMQSNRQRVLQRSR
jgi:hypothetical protein